MAFSLLLRRRRRIPFYIQPSHLPKFSTGPEPSSSPPPPPPLPSKPSSLSARLSFVFDQLDAIDRDRDRDRAAKHDALHRIRSWHEDDSRSAAPATPTTAVGPHPPTPAEVRAEALSSIARKEVELVHPWPEWIELMERLAQQNYFQTRARCGADEDRVAANAGIDLSGIVEDQTGLDFSRDWITVRTACTNFGRDRFDILRPLSRKDLQVLVGHGCPSTDPKVVFSAKLLRKYVHLDEGDVCSSCSLRNSCSRGYILTRKEDEARTLDVMRILLTFGFDHVNGTVENKPLMKMKSVKTVVRKLLHEVVKLSAVPIDPNLPPPVIKKPPPKVKQPPPPPKKRVGRDDVEMKKGDWLCPKCDFMNFAKNTVCLQCDAKRPKRQLLPGEWECPQCNFLNYRRNMECFHCEHKRPPDEFMENQIQAKQSGRRARSEGGARLPGVSDAWNFDFDDNESDGADVAAFEFADSPKGGQDSSLDDMPQGGVATGFEDDTIVNRRSPRAHERERYFSEPDKRNGMPHSPRTGFDDFDDEDDIDSYEIESNNNSAHEISRRSLSEFENTSDSEGFDDIGHHSKSRRGTKNYPSASQDDDHYDGSDNDLVEHPEWQSSHGVEYSQKARKAGGKESRMRMPSASDDDAEFNSDSDEDLDAVFRSKERKIGRRSLDRNNSRLGRNSDADDELLLDSESDGDDLHSSGIKMRRNKGVSDGRSNTFRNDNTADFSRGREFRLDDRKRRKYFDRDNEKLSFGGSPGYDRGSRRDHYGGFRGNDRGWESDRRQSGRTNRFNDRLEDSRGNYSGSHGDNWRGSRADYKPHSFNKPINREGHDFRRRESGSHGDNWRGSGADYKPHSFNKPINREGYDFRRRESGSHGDNWRGLRADYKPRSFNKPINREGYDFKRRERPDQYID